ncbi:SURF1 family protein [Methylibium sp.]|uniref:SURF1 family protein n=1 Tax=Methylibium sp. TaxID=2067992 RepID=UPI0025DF4060|nr:SURF1 family protein [Methylibium sp.]
MSANARRWVVLLATLVAVGVTARLGLWQLSRAAQKEAMQAGLQARSSLPALAPADLARSLEAAADQHYRGVTLGGRWLAEHTVFLDNRQMNGRPGFFVLTPLELAPGDAVLVQRGWAPRHRLDRALLPEVPTPSGAVSVSGRIAGPPAALYDFAEGEAGRLRQNIHLEGYGRETGLLLRPLTVMQSSDEALHDGLLREWPLPAADVHKHYGYAFQWFALATLFTGLYVWFQLLQPRLRQRRSHR